MIKTWVDEAINKMPTYRQSNQKYQSDYFFKEENPYFPGIPACWLADTYFVDAHLHHVWCSGIDTVCGKTLCLYDWVSIENHQFNAESVLRINSLGTAFDDIPSGSQPPIAGGGTDDAFIGFAGRAFNTADFMFPLDYQGILDCRGQFPGVVMTYGPLWDLNICGAESDVPHNARPCSGSNSTIKRAFSYREGEHRFYFHMPIITGFRPCQ